MCRETKGENVASLFCGSRKMSMAWRYASDTSVSPSSSHIELLYCLTLPFFMLGTLKAAVLARCLSSSAATGPTGLLKAAPVPK